MISEKQKQNIFERSSTFLHDTYSELGIENELSLRLEEVREEIFSTGTYTHNQTELFHGAKVAWRNSNRCIGRLYWKSLKVLDRRHLDSEDDIIDALESHLEYAFNQGQIRSVISIFSQKMPDEDWGPRILNSQLIRYAGFLETNGQVTGDPAEAEFTAWCQSKGWNVSPSPFELLPAAIQWPGKQAYIHKLSSKSHMMVKLLHPEFEWFETLHLQWYAVPVISDMLLEIGGVYYTAAPFNGWYMSTEIGSRNLGDQHRYNLLPVIAEKMGIDTKSQYSLWKDKAMVELNRAVIYSFQLAGVTITTHHEAAEQFLQFEQSESKHGRAISADWTWITPPMSGSATPVFHKEYDNSVKGPNFYYQHSPLKSYKETKPKGCPFHASKFNLI